MLKYRPFDLDNYINISYTGANKSDLMKKYEMHKVLFKKMLK